MHGEANYEGLNDREDAMDLKIDLCEQNDDVLRPNRLKMLPCGLFHDDQVDQYDNYPNSGLPIGAGRSSCDGHDNLVDPCGLFHDDQVDQYYSYPDPGFSTGAGSSKL